MVLFLRLECNQLQEVCYIAEAANQQTKAKL